MEDSPGFSPQTLAAVSLLGRSGGLVKRLRRFRRDRHTVPDAVNPATEAFFAKLCADEVAEEGETWFQRVRDAFAYKRRDLSLLLDEACAVIKTVHFELEIVWALDPKDPSTYTITRTVRGLSDPGELFGAAGDRVFGGTFTHIVFTLTRGVRVEDVIDAVEGLPETAEMRVSYPANCSECRIGVEGVDATVCCTGSTLELAFTRAASPRELFEAFETVRAAFRFTNDEALAALL